MEPVTLEQVLSLRDCRSEKQRELLEQYQTALICFGMNSPGPVKRTRLMDLGFAEGKARIEAVLRANGLEVKARLTDEKAAGQTGFWAVAADPVWLKRQMASLEEADRLSRLFDVDVFAPSGKKVSRSQLGLPPRTCFLCSDPAYVCGRSRRHTARQLHEYAQSVLQEHFACRQAQTIGMTAVKALLYEAASSPKPGLVDRFGSGAHEDMDFFTFLDSICALQPYFTDCGRIGLQYGEEPGPQLLQRLRPLGAAAEQAMFRATGQVNTHKGAIFSLGILCAAAGSAAWEEDRSPARLCAGAGQIAKASLEDYGRGLTTGGAKAFFEHRVPGIRGEAAGGFRSVLSAGLPAFLKSQKAGKSLNDCGLDALLALFCQVEDTNAIKRIGIENWRRQQEALRRRMEEKPLDPRSLSELDRLWTELRLSPGGCADLLAVTYFLYFWDRASQASDEENGRPVEPPAK